MNARAALVDLIDDLLPQTQCTRCGYAGCRPYAAAIAAGEAAINRCPPGGSATIAALAALTGKSPRPLDRACGSQGPLVVARVDEAACIGCTLCIAACPVDAIVGAPKRMHVVLASHCTGCELCVPPCPVDCIELEPAGRAWTASDAAAARRRHAARNARLARGERVAARGTVAPARAEDAEREQRRARVAEAFARARARRATARPEPK
jgi:electron transport complex protein RnfB